MRNDVINNLRRRFTHFNLKNSAFYAQGTKEKTSEKKEDRVVMREVVEQITLR